MNINEKYSHLDLDNPEHFNIVDNLEYLKHSRKLLMNVLKKYKNTGNLDKLYFLYSEYNFIEKIFKAIAEELDIYVTTDNFRFLNQNYKNYLIGENLIEFSEEDKLSYIPIGTVYDWIVFYDSIFTLSKGYPIDYIIVREHLLLLKNR